MSIYALFICSVSIFAQNNSTATQFIKTELNYEFSIPSEKGESQGIYFKNIHSISCDKDGNIYIIDWKIPVISKFDSTGNFICNIGRAGQGPGEYLSPQHICFDNDGNIILYDYGNGRIQILDSKGVYLSSFKTFKYIHKLVFVDGNLFTINTSPDPKMNLIEVLDLKGNRLLAFGQEDRLDIQRFRDINFKNIATNEKGNIYLGWDYFPWVHKYTSDGKIIQKIELLNPNYQKRGDDNLNTASSNKPGPLYYQIISQIFVDDDDIYAFTMNKEININVFSENGSMKSTYWAKKPTKETFFQSMVFQKNMGKKYFYLFSNSPECRVFVYSISN